MSEDLSRWVVPCGEWVTISGTYDNGGSMTIGAATCHLCGARRREHNTFRMWRKKGVYKQSDAHYYACGTRVYKEEDGRTCVEVGSRCIKVKGAV